MRFIIAAIFAAATVLAEFAGPALAADQAFCEAYTNVALKEAKQARELACGFDSNDPRWSEKPEVHMSFCLGARSETVLAEWAPDEGNTYEPVNRYDSHDKYDFTKKSPRQKALTDCVQCRAYTDTAMAQEAEEEKYHCHFAGTSDRWPPKTSDKGDDISQHFNFCMTMKGQQRSDDSADDRKDKWWTLYNQKSARDDELKQCKANYHPKIGTAKPSKQDLAGRNGGVIKGLPQDAVKNPCIDASGSMRRSLKECDPVGAASSSISSSKVDKGLPKGAVRNSTGTSKVLGAGLLENDQGASSQGPAATGAPGAVGAPAGGRSLGGATYNSGPR